MTTETDWFRNQCQIHRSDREADVAEIARLRAGVRAMTTEPADRILRLAAVIAELADNNPGRIVMFGRVVAEMTKREQDALLAGDFEAFKRAAGKKDAP